MSASQAKTTSAEVRTGSQDSRDEIMRAAMHLFANRGFHETSMSEVAREARVSKALIFWHFKTKEELFVAVLNRLLEPYFIDFAEEAGALDDRAQIQKLVEFYLLFIRENGSSVRFFIAQMLHGQHLSAALNNNVMRLYNGYRGLMIELIARAQEKGICSRRFTADAAAGFILSALNGLLIEYLFIGGVSLERTDMVAMVGDLLFADTSKAGSTNGAAS
jgi:AcrR family transcriptional regulator